MPEASRNDDAYLVMRGMVLRRIPEAEPEAEQCFQQAIEIAPERSDAYYNLGNLLLDRDAFELAESNFCACLKRDPRRLWLGTTWALP